MNPYPYFDDRWTKFMVGFAVANVVALLMWLLLGEEVNLGRISDQSWVPTAGGVMLLFLFSACVLATLILWLNMWVYWSRAHKSIMWLLLLLIGPWGTAIAFLFMVYRKDLAAFKHHEEQERMNLTHF
jgi:hypothetical protein